MMYLFTINIIVLTFLVILHRHFRHMGAVATLFSHSFSVGVRSGRLRLSPLLKLRYPKKVNIGQGQESNLHHDSKKCSTTSKCFPDLSADHQGPSTRTRGLSTGKSRVRGSTSPFQRILRQIPKLPGTQVNDPLIIGELHIIK